MSLAADPNGMVHVPAFDLPLSGLQSEDTHTALKRQAVESEAASKLCPANYESPEKAIAYRLCAEKIIYPPALAKFHARYKVEIRPEKIEGVPIEIFTPGAGVAPEN